MILEQFWKNERKAVYVHWTPVRKSKLKSFQLTSLMQQVKEKEAGMGKEYRGESYSETIEDLVKRSDPPVTDSEILKAVQGMSDWKGKYNLTVLDHEVTICKNILRFCAN